MSSGAVGLTVGGRAADLDWGTRLSTFICRFGEGKSVLLRWKGIFRSGAGLLAPGSGVTVLVRGALKMEKFKDRQKIREL